MTDEAKERKEGAPVGTEKEADSKPPITINIPVPAFYVCGLIGAMLIYLKATGQTNLSWFWVLSPMLWPFYLMASAVCIAAALGTCALIVYGLFSLVVWVRERQERRRRRNRK